MNKKTLILVILLGILPVFLHAEEMSLAEQIAEAKAQVEKEQALNKELINKLATKEREIINLNMKLKSLDEEIKILKEEHGKE